MKSILSDGTTVLLRTYNLETDPPLIVKHCFSLSSEEEIRQGDTFFTEKRGRVRLVAEIGGEIHGTVTLGQSEYSLCQHKARLFSVVISSAFRGTGLASLLIEFCKRVAREMGIRILLTDTWETNKRARSFYEKVGFVQYGQLPDGLPSHDGKEDEFEDEILYFMPI